MSPHREPIPTKVLVPLRLRQIRAVKLVNQIEDFCPGCHTDVVVVFAADGAGKAQGGDFGGEDAFCAGTAVD